MQVNREYTSAELRARSIMIVLMALVLAVSVVILSSMSLGWFTTSKRVEGGLTLSASARQVDAEFLCERMGFDGVYAEVPAEELDKDSIFPLYGLYPGDVLRFTITLTNTSDGTDYTGLTLKLIGASSEEPLTVTQSGVAKHYWLSSQLRITSLTASDGADLTVLRDDGFLFTPHDLDMYSDTPSDKVYTTADGRPADLSLCSFDLPAGETVTLTVTLEFYNSATLNQDAYKSFGVAAADGSYPKGYAPRRFLVDIP